jgi:hypothetical protein
VTAALKGLVSASVDVIVLVQVVPLFGQHWPPHVE